MLRIKMNVRFGIKLQLARGSLNRNITQLIHNALCDYVNKIDWIEI